MPKFNLSTTDNPATNYQNGLLPQRNLPGSWYQDSSSRSNLANFQLSSENRRILTKTKNFSFKTCSRDDFPAYTPELQKKFFHWSKELGWGIPASTIKTIFTQHIFNYFYIWYDAEGRDVAYSVCYSSDSVFHIAYVFYDPSLSHGDLPIRLALQAAIDCHQNNLKYCYLGRFDADTKMGYYKRNFPGFEYFKDGQWLTFQH